MHSPERRNQTFRIIHLKLGKKFKKTHINMILIHAASTFDLNLDLLFAIGRGYVRVELHNF